MRITVALFLVLVLVFHTDYTHAQSSQPVPTTFTDILEISELRDTALDTISVSAISWYPDIMRYFESAREYSQKNNPYDRFLASESIQLGREFLTANKQTLDTVAREYSIPASIFVAILRVESAFGQHTDTHQAVGVYASIIRYGSDDGLIKWAKGQLEALSQVAKETNTSITEIRSSYAGAIGYPQFLASSYLHYAVDGNDDGLIDLFTLEDALFSIGNYLVENGWEHDERKAVWRYNNSSLYVNYVFEYAQAL